MDLTVFEFRKKEERNLGKTTQHTKKRMLIDA